MHRLDVDEEKACVIIYGHITSENVSEVQVQLNEIIARKMSLVLDLNHIQEIDRAGLFMLFIYKKKNSAKNKVVKILLDPSIFLNHFFPPEMQFKLINNE
ncbi:hypothetical protein [Gramella sp. AN32]|uniref:STAS domain-containing protein n=1 Tax=Christiangramia antarctica TaxID=2058158 RepID=A0ABW5XAC9_9FLAO|nr:hypothetical protein [Gramella sp. AN32]MCM4157548.1 hypothetical protein [Gramella sp. AN32]